MLVIGRNKIVYIIDQLLNHTWCSRNLDISGIRDRIWSFLEKYGEKAYIVLRTALDIALDPEIDHRLGDFSYKHLVFRLRSMGINYNPQNLLRIMEREYGIVEKTYISTKQKWWSFLDLETTRKVLHEYSGSDEINDPKIRLLSIKYHSLEPMNILNTLRRLAVKNSFTSIDKEVFRGIVFNDLEKITDVLNEMLRHEEIFSEEIKVLNEILSLAENISAKLEARYSRQRRRIPSKAIGQEEGLEDIV